MMNWERKLMWDYLSENPLSFSSLVHHSLFIIHRCLPRFFIDRSFVTRLSLFIMIKSALALILSISFVASAQTQQAKPETKRPAPPQTSAGFILPADVNVRIEPDPRVLVLMAAINVAGFDYESGGQPLSPARAEIR